MKVILVDDEPLSLRHLKRMLEIDVGGVEVIGMYSDSSSVVDEVKKLQPDVVFLDIHMPGINGLSLGEQLQEAAPSPEIVFVTAYDQYALRAFELYAIDYILKPVQLNRLQQTVMRLRKQLKAEDVYNQEQKPSRICCFNKIRLQEPGKEPQLIKWRTSKAQELFAYMLHHRDRMVDRDTLLELLWPYFDESRAVKQLYTTIYHIRNTLRSNGLDTVSISSGDLETGYRLSLGATQMDTEEWETLVKRLDTVDLEHIDEHEQALELYKGNYFGDYEYLWAEQERERLRRLWLHHANRLSQFYKEQDMVQAAVLVNQRIQKLLPYNEESYFNLMKLYDSLGYSSGVEEQYGLLLARWEQELDSAVDASIAVWYERWKSESKSLKMNNPNDVKHERKN
jgi:two-component system LytT family response regulator